MSADLLAEFGQSSPAQSSSNASQATKQSQSQPQTSSLISDFDQSDDIFFGGTTNSRPNEIPALYSGSISGQYNTSQAPAPHQQAPSLPTFHLPRENNSDVLFDATEDTPASDTEDDWGDFEQPESIATPNQPEYPTSLAQAKGPISAPQPPRAQHITSTVDLLDSLEIEDAHTTTKKPPVGLENNPPAQIPNPPADSSSTWDDDSFGDWGEFTEAPSKTQTPTVQPSVATPSLVPKPTPKPKPTPNPKSPLKKNQVHTKPKAAPPQPAWDDDAFDDWGDFNDGPTPAPAPAPTAQKPSPKSPPLGSFTSGTTAQTSTVRPTNIPPPSVLLELLVDLMNNLQKEAAAANKSRQESTATASTEHQTETATKIHTTLSTAARIIAGRTLRWKRDTILSQSMRIGPARAGRSSGMKLSAVNKHEDVKEEQDAVDVLSLWRERAAMFNAVVQGAGLRPIPSVPGPAALKVVVAKPGQGAIKAAHACALCALKRDERVLRVDEEDVQDSFGEWWTEHWGHTGCRLFWEAYNGMLGQR